MADITAALVKELRERTGAGMMDCKKALVESNGDIELAIENMRKSGAIKAAKKAGNVAADGVIKTKIEGNYGIIGFRAVHYLIVVDAEREQHGFLQPLMGDPLTVDLLGNAQGAAVQQADHLVYRFARYGVYVHRGDVRTAFEGAFNNVL